MARGEGGSGARDGPERAVGRWLANAVLAFAGAGLAGAWLWLGFYSLDPGQAAVVLRLGRYVGTVDRPGLNWHWPPPLERHRVVNVSSIEREEFGVATPAEATEAGKPPGAGRERLASVMQTSDNNIVHLSFVVQYRIKDAFASVYRIAKSRSVLRDAAQASMREVVGRTTIDGVLSEKRGEVEEESRELLQQVLDRYDSGLAVLAVQLLEVQPPPEVRAAFDDVLAAIQDRSRTVNEAEGYANEVLPKARAQAIELRESARGYREARIAEARGEASRFLALARAYAQAPEVTRERLFLETMEEILPRVRKVIVEPGTAVLPHLPLQEAPAAAGVEERER